MVGEQMFEANVGWHENSRIASDKFHELVPLAGGFSDPAPCCIL